MRYIATYIRPGAGPSVGMNNILIREYASDWNALRFMHYHLREPHFPAGQYEVRTFPDGAYKYRPNPDGTYGRHVGYLYKRV